MRGLGQVMMYSSSVMYTCRVIHCQRGVVQDDSMYIVGGS